MLRLSESGPWRDNVFGESRLQVRRQANDIASAFEAPTVRVLDAFTTGGAQQAGGRDSTDIEWATNVDWARGKHAIRVRHPGRGRLVRQRQPHQLSRHLHVREPDDFDAGRPANYTQRIGDPLVEYSQWQAGALHPGRLARAIKNLTLSARSAPGAADAPRRRLEPRAAGRIHLVAVQERQDDHSRRRRHLLRLARRRHLRTDAAGRRRAPARSGRHQSGYPDPFGGGRRKQILPASNTCSRTTSSMPKRLMGNIGLSHQFTPTFGANVSYNRSRGYEPLPRAQHQCAAERRRARIPSLGNVTQVESTADAARAHAQRGRELQPARHGGCSCSPTTPGSNSGTTRTAPFSLPADSYDPAAEWGPVAGVARHNLQRDVQHRR